MYGRTDKSVAVGMLVSACSVLGIAAWLKPAASGYGTHTQLGLPPCNFLRLTHLPCPSCGLTTCFAWAIRFHFREAFLANPFGCSRFSERLRLFRRRSSYCAEGFRFAGSLKEPILRRLSTQPLLCTCSVGYSS